MRIIRRNKVWRNKVWRNKVWRNRVWSCALAALVCLFALQARAQSSFPDKPVHIIVGVSPGGEVDNVARQLAQQLSKLWGQSVIVENRLGAAGAVAYEFAAKAPADGYTLLVASDDITGAAALRRNLPYDLKRDLIPVSLAATAPNVLVVTPSLPVHNVSELIALAKSEPGKLTYGSGGVGSLTHLWNAMFASMAGIDIVHVPYKGSAASVVGVVDGEVDMAFTVFASVQGLAKAGKLRIIAVSTPQRSAIAPSIPTISESGLPGFTYATWVGVFAPSGISKDLLATLNTGIAKAANSPEMQADLAKDGSVSHGDSPAQFAKIVQDDFKEKVKIVKIAGVKAE